MDLSGAKVGDRFLLIEPGRRSRTEPETAEVTKLGRKYVYAARVSTGDKPLAWTETAYHIATGVAKSNYAGSAPYLTTPEWLADQPRCEELLARIRELGFETWRNRFDYTSATLAAVVELLEKENKRA